MVTITILKRIWTDFFNFVKKGWMVAGALLSTWLLFSPLLVWTASNYLEKPFMTIAKEIYSAFVMTLAPGCLVFVVYLSVARTLWRLIFRRDVFY